MGGRGHGHGHKPADPSAGDDWVFLIPPNQILCPTSIRFKLVTSSTSGTRSVGIRYHDDTDTYFESYANNTQSNNETNEYCFYVGANDVSESGPNFITAPLSAMCLDEDFTIASIVNNIKSGDVFSEITVFGDLFINPLSV